VAEPNWSGLFTDFDMDSRLKPDLEALVAAHRLMIGSTMETPDEARQEFNRPQMGGSAAKLWAAVNMAPVDATPTKKGTPLPAPKPVAEGEVVAVPDEGATGLGSPQSNGHTANV